jgi:hypothetical protein
VRACAHVCVCGRRGRERIICQVAFPHSVGRGVGGLCVSTFDLANGRRCSTSWPCVSTCTASVCPIGAMRCHALPCAAVRSMRRACGCVLGDRLGRNRRWDVCGVAVHLGPSCARGAHRWRALQAPPTYKRAGCGVLLQDTLQWCQSSRTVAWSHGGMRRALRTMRSHAEKLEFAKSCTRVALWRRLREACVVGMGLDRRRPVAVRHRGTGFWH